jgi:hypothetical protein
MAINRVRIDYTVYPSDHSPSQLCRKFRTFEMAKSAARALGTGARIYRDFHQTNKRGKVLGDWWSGKRFWLWNGTQFELIIDPQLKKPVRPVPGKGAATGTS